MFTTESVHLFILQTITVRLDNSMKTHYLKDLSI